MIEDFKDLLVEFQKTDEANANKEAAEQFIIQNLRAEFFKAHETIVKPTMFELEKSLDGYIFDMTDKSEVEEYHFLPTTKFTFDAWGEKTARGYVFEFIWNFDEYAVTAGVRHCVYDYFIYDEKISMQEFDSERLSQFIAQSMLQWKKYHEEIG